MQNTTFGLVIFIALSADLLSLMLVGLSFIPYLQKHNIDLSMVLPSSVIYQATDNGKPLYWLAAIAYMVIPLLISVKAFEKAHLGKRSWNSDKKDWFTPARKTTC